MIKCLLFLILFVGFIESANAEVYYMTNNTPEFEDQYSSYDYNELMDKGGERTTKENYFLAYAYYRNKNKVFSAVDYCKAINGFNAASNDGVADASFIIATMYYKGQCVKRSLKETRKYLLLAGERGYVQAQALLGRAYWGENVRDLFNKDTGKARIWLKKAAENGDSPSAVGLSYLYEQGVGGEKNPQLAFNWRLKASILPYGEFALGYFQPLGEYYEKGYGTNIDLVQAYKYYDLSGSVGSEGRARISKEMTREQIAEAKRQSRQWQEEHHHYNPGYNGLQRQADGSYR